MTHRPLLYVCAKWRRRTLADAEATHAAIAKALRLGWAPVFAPVLWRDHLNDQIPDEREIALQCDESLIVRCDAIMVVGDMVTEGMEREIERWRTCAGVGGERWGEEFTPETLARPTGSVSS